MSLIELGIGLIELVIGRIGLIELRKGLIELGIGLMELGIGLRKKNRPAHRLGPCIRPCSLAPIVSDAFQLLAF